jgi:hypothetical protein
MNASARREKRENFWKRGGTLQHLRAIFISEDLFSHEDEASAKACLYRSCDKRASDVNYIPDAPEAPDVNHHFMRSALSIIKDNFFHTKLSKIFYSLCIFIIKMEKFYTFSSKIAREKHLV